RAAGGEVDVRQQRFGDPPLASGIEVALDPRVTGLMLAHGSVLRTFVAIDKQAPLFLAADGIVVFRFEQHPGFDPFPDHLAALRLGFGWAVLLHHEPSRPAFALRLARIPS